MVEGAITIPFSRDGEVSVDMALGRRLPGRYHEQLPNDCTPLSVC